MAKSKPGASRTQRPKTSETAKQPEREAPKKRTNPVQFLRQVRQEGTKVTWPTRKETGITTAMVFVMVTLAAIFFLLVDLVLQTGVGFILQAGS